ncbi:hypothetical protein JCM19992_20130 [Thermostilla marina]
MALASKDKPEKIGKSGYLRLVTMETAYNQPMVAFSFVPLPPNKETAIMTIVDHNIANPQHDGVEEKS